MTYLLIGIGVLALIVFKFYSDLRKDNADLKNIELSTKISVLVKILNDAAFHGNAKIIKADKREIRLYKEGENKIIFFIYTTGILTIIWKYKYLQQEVVHERKIRNARNLSDIEQEQIGKNLIKEMAKIIENHQQNVGVLF